MNKVIVNKELKHKYDNHYSDSLNVWRKLGAQQKVANIFKVLLNKKFDNVIEVGSGDGNILSLLSEQNFSKKYTAAEISESAILQMKKKEIKNLIKIQKIDGYSLPFEDNEFELAICSHVVEHVEFPRILLREIKRISKEQVFEIPIDFSFSVDKKFDHFNSYGHINIYTPSLFKFLLLTEKFNVINEEFGMYTNATINYLCKDKVMEKIKLKLKLFIWSLLPKLRKIKPNTYTVHTK